MAYKEKDTKKWTAQWFETNAKGEKKKRRKRGFETKREALEYERQKKLNNSRNMDMKLSDFMEVYFEDKQNELKERTMKNKRYMMEQHKMKRQMEKAGVKKIRVHDLRHSHVAYLINKGVEPILIKERVGHKDIRITLNTYGHLYPNQQRKVADLLDTEKEKSPNSGNC